MFVTTLRRLLDPKADGGGTGDPTPTPEPEPTPTPEPTGDATGQKKPKGGKEGKDGDESPAEKTFTQADVDRIVKERLERDRVKAQKDAEEKALKDQGEWKKLAEQREAETLAERAGRAADQQALRQARLEHHTELEAFTMGFNDTDDVRLADFSSVTFDDKGQPNRAEIRKVLDALVKAKPHLMERRPLPNGTPARAPGAPPPPDQRRRVPRTSALS